jgi:hypothetical protein
MRNSIVLNEIFEDELCAVIFEIEYVINVPIQMNIMNTVKRKVTKKKIFFNFNNFFNFC